MFFALCKTFSQSTSVELVPVSFTMYPWEHLLMKNFQIILRLFVLFFPSENKILRQQFFFLKNLMMDVFSQLCKFGHTTLYIYHMASRVTYQNIIPGVTQKPWRVMSPDAEGRGWHNALGLSCHRGADILVKSPEKTCDTCFVTFLNKKSSVFK